MLTLLTILTTCTINLTVLTISNTICYRQHTVPNLTLPSNTAPKNGFTKVAK